MRKKIEFEKFIIKLFRKIVFSFENTNEIQKVILSVHTIHLCTLKLVGW